MKKLKKYLTIICILILVVMSGIIIYFKSDYYRQKVLKKNLYDASQKTIQYYYDNYKKHQFAGILDWPALGLYGFGEEISGPVWTVDGKNAAYFRELQVKNGDGISKTKNTDFQRTVIGITSAKKDPRNFGDIDFIKTIKETMLDNGHFADSVEDKRTKKPVGDDLINAHSFGAIALHCAGEPIPNRDKAIRWLEKNQHLDGGFTWDVKDYDNKEDYNKITSDVDMTAAALMTFSILKADKEYPPVKRALEFIKKQQLDNGGFQSWGVENPESDVWAIQALLMYGENPMSKKWEKKKGQNPVTFMLKHQLKNGAFTHVLDEKDILPVYDNSMTTYECLYGMADAYNGKTTYDKLFEANKPGTEEILYSDFKEGDYGYKEAVNMVYEYVIDHYKDGTFRPNEKITKGKLSRYLVNALNLQSEFYTKYSGDELKFIDNKGGDSLKIDSEENYIELCVEKGIFKEIESLNIKGDRDKEIKGNELKAALINASKYKNKKIKINKIIDKDFKEDEIVNRVQCALYLYNFKKFIK